MELDTFLVTVYTHLDDLYQAHLAARKPVRPGATPTLSDSEVLTLLVCAHWSGRSERSMLAYAARHWRAYFPRLLDQSAFNRRARDLGASSCNSSRCWPPSWTPRPPATK